MRDLFPNSWLYMQVCQPRKSKQIGLGELSGHLKIHQMGRIRRFDFVQCVQRSNRLMLLQTTITNRRQHEGSRKRKKRPSNDDSI